MRFSPDNTGLMKGIPHQEQRLGLGRFSTALMRIKIDRHNCASQ